MSRQSVLLAGLAGLLVVALWWIFLYTPGQEDLARVEDEIAAAEAEMLSLQRRVAQLEAVRSRAPETEAAIARLLSVIPDDPDLAGALRQIKASAEDSGLELVSVVAERPTVLDEPTGLASAAITLTAEGSYFQVVDFFRRLEDPQITARGLRFNDVTITGEEYPTLSVSITGAMFSVLEPVPTPGAPVEAEDAAADASADADGGDES